MAASLHRQQPEIREVPDAGPEGVRSERRRPRADDPARRSTRRPPTPRTKTYTAAGVDPVEPDHRARHQASQVDHGHLVHQRRRRTRSSSTPPTPRRTSSPSATSSRSTASPTTIVGLVSPTLTGDVSDVYFDLSTAQSLVQREGLRRRGARHGEERPRRERRRRRDPQGAPRRHGAHLEDPRRPGDREPAPTRRSSPTTSAGRWRSSSCSPPSSSPRS